MISIVSLVFSPFLLLVRVPEYAFQLAARKLHAVGIQSVGAEGGDPWSKKGMNAPPAKSSPAKCAMRAYSVILCSM